MKYLIIAALALLSCNTHKQPVHRVDTVYVDREVPVYIEVECNTDSLLHIVDSMHARIDTYAKLLLRERARLEQVRKYFQITKNKESQLKFIRGWIDRATAP